jgi:hypothetical protein
MTIVVGQRGHRAVGIGFFVVAVGIAIAGCGGSGGPAVVSVAGTVTRDGQPLVGADVMFLPERGAPSSGKTDASGEFTLTFNDGRPGAVPGKHQVFITLPGPEVPPPTGQEKPPVKVQPPMEFRQQAEVKADGENRLTFEVGK